MSPLNNIPTKEFNSISKNLNVKEYKSYAKIYEVSSSKFLVYVDNDKSIKYMVISNDNNVKNTKCYPEKFNMNIFNFPKTTNQAIKDDFAKNTFKEKNKPNDKTIPNSLRKIIYSTILEVCKNYQLFNPSFLKEDKITCKIKEVYNGKRNYHMGTSIYYIVYNPDNNSAYYVTSLSSDSIKEPKILNRLKTIKNIYDKL